MQRKAHSDDAADRVIEEFEPQARALAARQEAELEAMARRCRAEWDALNAAANRRVVALGGEAESAWWGPEDFNLPFDDFKSAGPAEIKKAAGAHGIYR
jgi:hypothetical protein